ncbi:MAG: folylpolyglutamate synthase/dihydrofolate synthase family protein [Acidimicrobiales bacterium]
MSESDQQFGSAAEPPLLPLPGVGTPSFGETLAWLDRHVNLEAIESGRAGRLGLASLERISALVGALGDPQATYPIVHVTGTNGKGSTSRMTASILQACGLSVGTYSSPHLERINERLEFAGTEITDESFVSVLGTVAEIERFLGIRATWFELVTAAAYSWFADMAAEAAVVEVGLGGRFDATNVGHGDVAVVTNVELDHTQILGTTRESIAGEKAGILKGGSLLVLGAQDPVVSSIFEAEAELVGTRAIWRRGAEFGCSSNRLAVGGRLVDLWTPLGRFSDVHLPLHGAHQGDNAACAVAAAQALLGTTIEEDIVCDALGAVRVPGRLEVVRRHPLVVLDGAHNPAGATAAGRALKEDFGAARRVIVVMGCLRGRDPGELLSSIGPERIATVVACRPPSPRAQEPGSVVAAAQALGLLAEESGTTAEAVGRALEVADRDDIVLVTGSLYVVGAARAALC